MSVTTSYGTINNRLQSLAEEEPEKPAYIFWDKDLNRSVFTRKNVWDKSRKCAAFLRRRGIEKGDVVCNTLVNSKERLITTFGTTVAGAVSMNAQMLLTDGEDILKNLKDGQCKAIIVSPQQKGICNVLEKLKYTDDESGTTRYKGLPNLTLVLLITVGDDYLDRLDEEPEMYEDETMQEDDLAVIWTTSGSTGFVKLIPQTHRRVLLISSSLQRLIGFREDSLYFNQRSLGWVAGAPAAYLVAGLTRVLIDLGPGQAEDTGALLVHILQYEKCDTALIMPSTIQSIIDRLDAIGEQKLSTPLRRIGTGGGPISKAIMRALGRVTESIAAMYGASEFGVTHGLTVTNPSDYTDTCIGYPSDPDSMKTKIVDENLQEVERGESGEVLFQGPTLLDGYLNNPAANKEVFLEDRWFRTSDIGHMDEKGQLFVYCRKSFAINHRGYLHYPGWLETLIDRHPDIKKSFVIGIPDPADYEKICLCLTTATGSSLTKEAVRDYCRSLFSSTGPSGNDSTPIPEYYLFFDSFPQSATGKIDRKAVKEIAMKRVETE